MNSFKLNGKTLIILAFPVIALLIVSIGLRFQKPDDEMMFSSAQTISSAQDKDAGSAQRINAAVADSMIQADPAGTMLVDVRTEEEYTGDGHVKGAMLLPVGDLEQRYKELLPYRDTKKIIVYCRSGARSNRAAQFLASKGFKVFDFGSMMSWKSTAIPIVYGK